jgi:hypothetical protein
VRIRWVIPIAPALLCRSHSISHRSCPRSLHLANATAHDATYAYRISARLVAREKELLLFKKSRSPSRGCPSRHKSTCSGVWRSRGIPPKPRVTRPNRPHTGRTLKASPGRAGCPAPKARAPRFSIGNVAGLSVTISLARSPSIARIRASGAVTETYSPVTECDSVGPTVTDKCHQECHQCDQIFEGHGTRRYRRLVLERERGDVIARMNLDPRVARKSTDDLGPGISPLKAKTRVRIPLEPPSSGIPPATSSLEWDVARSRWTAPTNIRSHSPTEAGDTTSPISS